MFEIKVTKADPAQSPVKLIVGLNARSSSLLQTQLRVQEFQQGSSIQYSVEDKSLPELGDWGVTLRSEDQAPVELKLQNQEEPIYHLTLNNLSRSSVTVDINLDGESTSLQLQPALRLYERNEADNTPILNSGNTVIGTETLSVESTSSQPQS